jgi:hypothetical protein
VKGRYSSIGRSIKFSVNVGVEESIVNASAVSILPQFLRRLCFYTSGAFTIDSSTPTLTENLNEHPIFITIVVQFIL